MSPQSLMGLTHTSSDVLPGTLELLVQKALASGPAHGYGIVAHLRITSRGVLHTQHALL